MQTVHNKDDAQGDEIAAAPKLTAAPPDTGALSRRGFVTASALAGGLLAHPLARGANVAGSDRLRRPGHRGCLTGDEG